jgi:hypothetical protein
MGERLYREGDSGLAFIDVLRPRFEWHFDPEPSVNCERDVENIEAVDAKVGDHVARDFSIRR